MTLMKSAGIVLSLALTIGTIAFAAAQGPTAVDGGSMSAVVDEIRLLRLSVERSTQLQAQIQAIAVSLSAQQSRLVQMASRLDEIRKDTDAKADELRAVRSKIAQMTEAESSAMGAVREEVAGLIRTLRTDEKLLSEREAASRTRTVEAEAALQMEIARWNDLMARLDQATR